MKPIDCSISALPSMDYTRFLHQGSSLVDQEIEADVLVIGSRAGGGASMEYLTSQGLSVVGIEAGGYHPLKYMNQNLTDMIEYLAWGQANSGAQDGSLRIVHGKGIGGSTTMHMLTMTSIPEKILLDWQGRLGLQTMGPEAINPIVSEIRNVMNIRTIDRSAVNKNAEKWIEGCDALGAYWTLNDRNAGQCVQSGRCHTGCPFGGKVSTDVSFIPRALNQGLRLYTNTRVTEVQSTNGVATGVKCQVHDPMDDRVLGEVAFRGKAIILACGALLSPALLLASGMQSPSGQVGGRLCVQPGVNIIGEFDEEIYPWRGITNPIHIDEWVDHPEGGFFIEPGMLDPSIIGDFIPHIGEQHLDIMDRYRFMTAGQILYRDDGSRNRVVLTDGKPDVVFDLSSRDLDRIRFAIRKSSEILLAGGAKAVYVGQRHPMVFRQGKDLDFGDLSKITQADFHWESVHVHGSCPMSNDPASGVVDQVAECHHVKRLFIGDASIFPTAIGTNTTIPAAIAGVIAAQGAMRRYFSS